MLLIWREVEVYELGPIQLHDPPLTGCGPRSTSVEAELTVAVDSLCQAPLVKINGTMVVGVQLELVIVTESVVVAVRLPEVPVIVTVAVPGEAELLAVRVSTLLPVVGFVAKEAVTPEGSPEAASVTLPVNPSTSPTVMVSVPVLP